MNLWTRFKWWIRKPYRNYYFNKWLKLSKEMEYPAVQEARISSEREDNEGLALIYAARRGYDVIFTSPESWAAWLNTHPADRRIAILYDPTNGVRGFIDEGKTGKVICCHIGEE